MNVVVLALLGNLLPAAQAQPAPGISFESPRTLRTTAGVVALDQTGMASVQRGGRIQDPSYKSYSLRLGGRPGGIVFFYYPRGYRVISWTLLGQRGAMDAELVVGRATEPWQAAKAVRVMLEEAPEGARVQFVAPDGVWSVGLIVSGSAPIVRTEIRVSGDDLALADARPVPAGTLRAAIRDVQGGKPVPRWQAFLRDVRPESKEPSQLSQFLNQRAIAADAAELRYASAPPGSWELRIEARGFGTRRDLVGPVRPGETVELGTIFVGRLGALRTTILFAGELPRQQLRVALYEGMPAMARERRRLITAREVRPAERMSIDFENISPGEILVHVNAAGTGLWHEASVTVNGRQRAEVSFEFLPILIRGEVWRRPGEALPGVRVRAHGGPGDLVEATTNEQGLYELRVWQPGEYGLTAFPPGDMNAPFWEQLTVPQGAIIVEHDIDLPSGVLEGVLTAEDTGEPIAGATVAVQMQSRNVDPTHPRRPPGTGTEREMDNTSQTWKGVSFSNGQYRIEGLMKAAFEVRVQAKGFAPLVADAVQVPAQRDFRLRRSSYLRGKVLSPTGLPVGGALVGLTPNPGGFDREVRSLDTGDFVLEDLGAPPYVLVVGQCGYALALRQVSGNELTVRLEPAGPPVNVSFVDDKGEQVRYGGGFFEIDGQLIPQASLGHFLSFCGIRRRPEGHLIDLFPLGPLRALDGAGQILSMFTNDGRTASWTIPVAGATGFAIPSGP